jgi:hypothetical protein
MDTRSGEMLSALVALALGATALTTQSSFMFVLLTRADAFPEWAILSVVCSLISLLCIFLNNERTNALGRFLSGTLWGTVILLSVSVDYYGALFWCGIIFFSFDILAVITKGNLVWNRKSRLSQRE